MRGPILSRRALLLGSAAAVAALPLAAVVVAQPTIIGVDVALPGSDMTVIAKWAVGSAGEYDWQAIEAYSAEDAYRQWRWTRYGEADAVVPDAWRESVERVPGWDSLKLEEIRPVDWMENGLGSFCDRCDSETCVEAGGRVTSGGEIVCEDCMELSDWLQENDQDRAVEDLADLIVDAGADDVRAQLAAQGNWEFVLPETWAKAIAEAASA